MGRLGLSARFIPTSSGPGAMAGGAGGGGGGGGGGGRGSSSGNPAYSGRDAYDQGQRGDTVWIEIEGSGSFSMTFDPSDRYGNGRNGWIKYDASFFGGNNGSIDWVVYGQPSSIIPAWNTNSTNSTSHSTINQGTLRIGREQSHQGGNSLSTVRVSLPKLTQARYSMSATAGGNQTADFGTGWHNFSGIINNNPYQNNGNGYWALIWSGNPNGNESNDWLVLDPGNLRSGNGGYSQQIGPLSFGSERGSASQIPQMIWGTTDAYNEYSYIQQWELWLH